MMPNFRLKGYISHQYLWNVRLGNGCTTTLPLEVFTQRNFVGPSRIYLTDVEFYFLTAFWATLWGTSGQCMHSICSSLESQWSTSYSSWVNFFAISYDWDVISGNLSKSTFFEGGGSLWVQISDGRGQRLPTTVCARKLEWLPFCVVSKNIRSAFFGFVTKHACDKQTDRHRIMTACLTCFRFGDNLQINITNYFN